MKSVAKSELFRQLPSVDEVLRMPGVDTLAASQGLAPVTDTARAVMARLRSEIASGLLDEAGLHLALAGIAGAIEAQLRRSLGHSLRSVINATGVILHTNLGRAPLAGNRAGAHIYEIAGRDFSNLEFSTSTAASCRASDIHVDRLFRSLLRETLMSRRPLSLP